MNRAEKAALVAYPDVESPDWDNKPKIFFSQMAFRNAYLQGYRQAEKDLVLTWEDMRTIIQMGLDMKFVSYTKLNTLEKMEQSFYEDVLCKFNEQKGKK